MACPGESAEVCGAAPKLYLALSPALTNNMLIAIANQMGLALAPGNHWVYVNYLTHEEGESTVLGYTPRDPTLTIEQTYYDDASNSYPVDDSAVYITSAAITGTRPGDCQSDINCLQAVMAHEATHSWFEYWIDNNAQSRPPDQIHESLAPLFEEYFIDLALISQGKLNDESKSYIQQHIDRFDRPMLGLFSTMDIDDVREVLLVDYQLYFDEINIMQNYVFNGNGGD